LKHVLRYFIALGCSCLILACGDQNVSSEDHLDSAKAFLESSDRPAAIVELKKALKKDYRNSRARFLLGNLYFEAGSYEDADKELSKALATGVDNSLVAPVLAQVLLALGAYERLDNLALAGLDPESRSTVQAAKGLSMIHRDDLVAATEIMETVMENEPSSPYAQVAAARLAMEVEDYESARSRLKKVFAKSPKYAPAWNLLGDIESAQRQPKNAEIAYSKVIKLSGNNSFDALLNRAMMRIYQGNFKGARQDLDRLKGTFYPSRYHPGVQFAWGLVHLQAKQIDAAAKSFEQASDYSDAYPQTWYYLAAIYLEKGLVEMAMSSIYRFLGLVPNSIVGSILAAKLELGQKKYSKAEKLLLPVVESRPEDVEALNLLATALLAQGKSGEGVELLARIAALEPDSTEAKARLGAGFLAAGSEELGIETLRDILQKDPGYEQADILIVLNFLREKKLAQAILSAQQYRDRNPASATSYDLLGRAYLANGEETKAKREFKKALQLRPGDPGAGNRLAEFALEAKDYKTAREYYWQILQHNPADMQTRMNVASSFALEGREREMLESLNSTLAAYPRAMEPRLVKARYFIAKGQLELAAPLLDELTEDQKNHPDALVTLAGFELAASRYNQALSTLGKLIDRYPKVSQYHYMKSKAYAGLGDMEQSAAELERTVSLDPGHFYAKIALARLALLSGRNEVFEEKLAELREVAPDNPDVLKLEIASAQRRGDNKKAEQLLETLFKQEPTTSNVIALATHKQSVGDIDGAIVKLQHWVQDHPSEIIVREKLAEIYGSSNQIGGVIYQYQKILAMVPDHVIALNNLAWNLLDEDPKQALTYAERAIEIAPDSASILDTLAMAQLRNNSVIEARRSIDRALALAPDRPELHFHDAQIRVAEGDTKAALIVLTTLLKKSGEFPERPKAQALLKYLAAR
jgi:putative PEP-CTERM system TPR-repeat lipoprotein